MGTNENINNVNGNNVNPKKVPQNVEIRNTGETTDNTRVVDFQATQRIDILGELTKMGKQQIISNQQGSIVSEKEIDNKEISVSKEKEEQTTSILKSSSMNSKEQIAQSENPSNINLLNENVLKTPNDITEQPDDESIQNMQQTTQSQNDEKEINNNHAIEQQNNIKQTIEPQSVEQQNIGSKSINTQAIEEENVNKEILEQKYTEKQNDQNQNFEEKNTNVENVVEQKIEATSEVKDELIDKEKKHAQDKKDYRLERMLFDRINAMQGKIKESIELIQKFERINAKEENLPNIVTTLHDKLTHEVIKQFRTVGIEFNMKSYLVQSIVSDLLAKFEEGITEFRNCSENLNFVREVQDDFEARVELAPTSRVKNIFACLRGIFKPERKQEKLEELERERQKKKLEEANIHLIKYKFINSELEKYTIKNNIVSSLSREILYGQSSGQNLALSEFVSQKIAEEMQKLGLENLIPELMQKLYAEYKEKDSKVSIEEFSKISVGELRKSMKVKKFEVLTAKVNATVASNGVQSEDDERMVV
ncbi:MAG: hypothetical protein IKD77_02190 [Bacilli bacterium]|nr:hypothetical protein [Bacilli bacterium]